VHLSFSAAATGGNQKPASEDVSKTSKLQGRANSNPFRSPLWFQHSVPGEPGENKIMKRTKIEEHLRLTTVAIIPQTTSA
jgi:hypothetical protein